MSTLKRFKDNHIYIELSHAARLLKMNGLSTSIPLGPDGSMSLPFAIARACGFRKQPDADCYSVYVNKFSSACRLKFILCWEALELEVEDDIVVWSESVGLDETVRRMRSLAKFIELS